ncbi:glycosyltransferase family 2 protein [Pseudomonas farris]
MTKGTEKNMHSLPSPRADSHPLIMQKPHVAILLCTYNGAKFIRSQLDSILLQTHENWSLYISDDGSTDATLEIIESYQRQLPPNKLTLLEGPRQGFSKNFISLIKNKNINADFFAFSDQDDVWFLDKLERSIKYASRSLPSRPFLYCSRTKLVNVDGIATGLSPLFSKRPAFRNALVQSLAGANTMLINTISRELLSKTPEDTGIPAHDWLAYLLISAAGGEIVYDSAPTLEYRQHENNLIGANSGIAARFSRLVKMFSGRFKQWNSQNIYILEKLRACIAQENIKSFDNFAIGRTCNLFLRIVLIKKSGIYRQTLAGSISLWIAVVFNKI